MSRQRRRLSVQSLETRKLMAADGVGGSNLIAEGTPEDPVVFSSDTTRQVSARTYPSGDNQDADAFFDMDYYYWGFETTNTEFDDFESRRDVDIVNRADATDAAMASFYGGIDDFDFSST